MTTKARRMKTWKAERDFYVFIDHDFEIMGTKSWTE